MIHINRRSWYAKETPLPMTQTTDDGCAIPISHMPIPTFEMKKPDSLQGNRLSIISSRIPFSVKILRLHNKEPLTSTIIIIKHRLLLVSRLSIIIARRARLSSRRRSTGRGWHVRFVLTLTRQPLSGIISRTTRLQGRRGDHVCGSATWHQRAWVWWSWC